MEVRRNVKWLTMLGVGLGILMSTLDASIINIALPALVKEFNTSFAKVELVTVSYLLIVSAFVLGASRLGDMYGKKRPYLIGLIVFTVSSLLCGLSGSENALIAFRLFQGGGAVFLTGLGAAIVTEVFPDSQRGQALGIVSALASVGLAIGPSAGGVLLGILGWRSIFFVNVPIGILATYLVFRHVPESVNKQPNARFDWLGTIIAVVLLGCFVLGMSVGQDQGFESGLSLSLLAIAAVTLVLFIFAESRIKQPMLELSIFRNREVSASLLACLLMFAVNAGLLFLIPFFLEAILQYSAEQAGLLLSIAPIVSGLFAPVSGKLSDQLGARSISIAGLSLMLAGCLAVSTFSAQLTPMGYILRMLPLGLGYGMFQTPNNSIVFGGVSNSRLSIASGLLSLARSLGQTAGIPILGAVFTLRIASQAQSISLSDLSKVPANSVISGFQGGCYLAAGLAIAAILVTGWASWNDKRDSPSPTGNPD